MKIAALALLLAALIALPAGAYDPARHPKPTAPGSAYELGRLRLHAGDWEGAAALFRRAIAENRIDHRAYTLLGYSLRHLGRLKEAIAAYDEALRINPVYAEALEYRGVAHALAGDRAAAMRDHGRLLRLNPHLAEDLKRAIDQAAAQGS